MSGSVVLMTYLEQSVRWLGESWRRASLLACAVALGCAGCVGGGDGEPCQVNGDCNAPLTCRINLGNDRGLCGDPSNVGPQPMTVGDAGAGEPPLALDPITGDAG